MLLIDKEKSVEFHIYDFESAKWSLLNYSGPPIPWTFRMGAVTVAENIILLFNSTTMYKLTWDPKCWLQNLCHIQEEKYFTDVSIVNTS